ncbi:phosphoribosylformylglycinamidine synthase subunit PurQ [Pseudoroseicyclus sp. CXY001]|uniref:phosphoribosylformylglycinamidine synthase subunit PurQ n=1 Tax=Pseudoroseicyclus sp. CXY001 TaxID=3242492 RepID=UPI003570ED67
MKAAVLVFPGSNCDRDVAVALKAAGAEVTMVWHKEPELPGGLDLVAVPGGFSFGDYLRCGAIAARSPVTGALRAHVERGGFAIGICNGFQVLTETGILPGALMRNAGLKFISRPEPLIVATEESPFTRLYRKGQRIEIPIAHHDGNYVIGPELLAELQAEDRIALRYASNPNGSQGDIAGVLSANRRVLGLMPHPERAVDQGHGGTDGRAMFDGLVAALQDA